VSITQVLKDNLFCLDNWGEEKKLTTNKRDAILKISNRANAALAPFFFYCIIFSILLTFLINVAQIFLNA
jgi:hypothetical protein